MLYVVGSVNGKAFQREWHAGSVVPNILVADVTEIQADGDEQNYVNNLCRRYKRDDLVKERNDKLPEADRNYSPVWKGNDAKSIWGFVIERRNDAKVHKIVNPAPVGDYLGSDDDYEPPKPNSTQTTQDWFVVKPTNNQNYLVKSAKDLVQFSGRVITTKNSEGEATAIAEILQTELREWERERDAHDR